MNLIFRSLSFSPRRLKVVKLTNFGELIEKDRYTAVVKYPCEGKDQQTTALPVHIDEESFTMCTMEYIFGFQNPRIEINLRTLEELEIERFPREEGDYDYSGRCRSIGHVLMEMPQLRKLRLRHLRYSISSYDDPDVSDMLPSHHFPPLTHFEIGEQEDRTGRILDFITMNNSTLEVVRLVKIRFLKLNGGFRIKTLDAIRRSCKFGSLQSFQVVECSITDCPETSSSREIAPWLLHKVSQNPVDDEDNSLWSMVMRGYS
ncbi:uncharacterized protein KY384_008143 [Bacidia gigantensis]|uniref:uncharacterized protein n=1 Tax=Bacidia gigantensis TaxID=2732470 RepID=UPI001D03B486|nr:uncharacterized protein KY384_008143 [Bacidia gigantensis]KAG8526714.1 hypothetical protein KY384_008143 [Bacidia gigantensis]